MSFEEEEQICDQVINGLKDLSCGPSDCESGACVLPGGERTEPVQQISLPTAKWKAPSKDVFKPFLEAVSEFSMIKDGDRLLVCLSGGKDSLSMLHCVRQYQFVAKKQVTVGMVI